ncbi:UNVERIFIED_CONTAM: hypothetical protein GTU68_009869 [Idotea baltica]|nr:hypothetical protein [Idotea baltica]
MSKKSRLETYIREVPDFPIPGILFKDISPLFLHPEIIKETQVDLTEYWRSKGATKVIGIGSRGFLFGPQMAADLGAGFVIARKKGKLPPETLEVSYELEYGQATIEIVKDSIVPGDRVIVHDDLLATGGTALAAAQLAKESGAEVIGFSFIIALTFLNGHEKLHAFTQDIHTLINFDQ